MSASNTENLKISATSYIRQHFTSYRIRVEGLAVFIHPNRDKISISFKRLGVSYFASYELETINLDWLMSYENCYISETADEDDPRVKQTIKTLEAL